MTNECLPITEGQRKQLNVITFDVRINMAQHTTIRHTHSGRAWACTPLTQGDLAPFLVTPAGKGISRQGCISAWGMVPGLGTECVSVLTARA